MTDIFAGLLFSCPIYCYKHFPCLQQHSLNHHFHHKTKLKINNFRFLQQHFFKHGSSLQNVGEKFILVISEENPMNSDSGFHTSCQ